MGRGTQGIWKAFFSETAREEECTPSDTPCMVPQHSQVQSHIIGAVKCAVILELEELKADVL